MWLSPAVAALAVWKKFLEILGTRLENKQEFADISKNIHRALGRMVWGQYRGGNSWRWWDAIKKRWILSGSGVAAKLEARSLHASMRNLTESFIIGCLVMSNEIFIYRCTTVIMVASCAVAIAPCVTTITTCISPIHTWSKSVPTSQAYVFRIPSYFEDDFSFRLLRRDHDRAMRSPDRSMRDPDRCMRWPDRSICSPDQSLRSQVRVSRVPGYF